MLTTKKPENSDQVALPAPIKRLLALAWMIACTTIFLMMWH
jgi:hypothetical protein